MRGSNLRLYASAAVAISTLSLAPLAGAADQQQHPQAAEEAILVTAKMSDADLRDYAGSAVVFSDDQLALRHVDNLTALSFAAPNISLDAIGTFRGVANFSIRGLGVNSSIPSIDPAVGLFVDNIFMGINAGTLYDALDVANVQILRGPQSVLFGRNTTGGAVLVATGDPTWDWQGSAQLNVETPLAKGRGAPMATVRGMISGPISENVAVRLAALHSSDGGYFRNDFDGRAFGRAETSIMRGTILFRPTDRLTLASKAEWMKSDGDGAPGHNNGLFPRDSFRLELDERGFHHSTAHMAMLRAEWEMGEGHLTSLSAWRDYRLRTRNDIDSSPIAFFHSDTGTQQEQWSQDLYYRRGSDRVDMLVGAYAFGQQQGYDEDRNLIGLGQPKNYGGGRQKHHVYALYGNVDVHLNSALTVSGGLRWSTEKKRVAITYVRARDACSAIDRTCPVTGEREAGENNGFEDGRRWNAVSPSLSLAYRADDRASLYVNWRRGERSGGYNLRITQPAAFEQVTQEQGSPAFDAEQVDNFEAGLKWQSQDRKVTGNIALFWTEVADMQREISVASATSGLAQSVYNTADARIRGAEWDAEWTPLLGLKLRANAGYIDARYRRIFYDISGDGKIDAGDAALHLPRAPKWTWGAGGEWRHSLGASALILRADYQHRARYAYTDNNYGWVSAIDSLDASIGLDLAKPAMRISLHGRNLLDQVQFGGDTQLGFAGGPNSGGSEHVFGDRPAVGTFSPLMKGRRIGAEWAMRF